MPITGAKGVEGGYQPEQPEFKASKKSEKDIPVASKVFRETGNEHAAIENKAASKPKLTAYIAKVAGIAGSGAKRTNGELRRILENSGGKFGLWQSENVTIDSEGKMLEGMLMTSTAEARSGKVVMVCSGSHKSHEFYTLPMVRELTSMGHDVLVFNYRGFGKSQGTPSEKGLYADGEAALQLLKDKGYEDDDTVILGYSLGAAVAAELATHHPIDVVIDRGFSSAGAIAQKAARSLGTVAKKIFDKAAPFNSLDKLEMAQGRVFVVRGQLDTGMDSIKLVQKVDQLRTEHPPEGDQRTKWVAMEVYRGHFHDPIGTKILRELKEEAGDDVKKSDKCELRINKIYAKRSELWYAEEGDMPNFEFSPRNRLSRWLNGGEA